ncbi:DUF1989 domain-containing protein [Cobetia sp. 3AK]|uniref:DUF1989 domain-containing protein n=1 Tax=Cobetia sp. 3AK TaxID=3040020 RepID=UPI0024486AF2|nr:aminomethyltransferase family protein [Cobetia sp. 3AK]MDH2374030.1 DUF1989 domain-containing protein [Cobetia sp. 3AK]
MGLAVEIPAATPNQPYRYRIAGLEVLALDLSPGDSVQVSSVDGAQSCEWLALKATGGEVAEAAQQSGESPREAVKGAGTTIEASLAHFASVVSPGDHAFASQPQASEAQETSGNRSPHTRSPHTQARLEALGVAHCPPSYWQRLSAAELPAEIRWPLEAPAARLILLAPGSDMTIEGERLATELEVSHFCTGLVGLEHLPVPLAPIRQETRVAAGTVEVYEVKQGEWIQIIDVAGRQCSDFVAFDATAWAQGEELGLDAGATRSLSGHCMPNPGLYSVFFDQHLHPMLEVIQDTVGRHDSFMLACSPQYYEHHGYFGHDSCTVNFNNALSASHGIRQRASWPAINFFFNTWVQPCGTLAVDEPWSRPGDYVLLRADRDLICASSACPDDIDAANGWVPTDIHVRIYAAEHDFPRGIAYRNRPEELPRMTLPTAFHPCTSALTKQYIDYHGYWLATHYEGWGAKAEYLACRERVAVMDLSALRKFEVAGPDAERLLQYALTRNVRRLSIGEVVYSAMCQETGGMLDDGTLFRMGEQTFRWICGDPASGQWLRDLAEQQGYRVTVRDSTHQLHNIALQGPKSREVLAPLIWNARTQPEVETLGWFRFMVGRLAGPNGIPLMVSRTGYTGELGYEVWCHPKDAPAVWEAIWAAGEPHGIAPLGLDALDMLRIEAGLIFAGHEFCPQTSPYEAGIGFTVPMKSKEDDFVGRAAMQRETPESRHRIMGLRVDSSELVSHGDLVYHGRYPVGVITSATRSPLLNQSIAMCRLAPDFSSPGTQLEIGQLDGHQKRLAAEVVTLPFHDPERLKVRS